MFEFQNNLPFFSIIFFIIFYVLIIKLKPSFIFYKDNTLKEFGIGYKNKTIIPLWLVAIILAILSYIIAMYFGYLY